MELNIIKSLVLIDNSGRYRKQKLLDILSWPCVAPDLELSSCLGGAVVVVVVVVVVVDDTVVDFFGV